MTSGEKFEDGALTRPGCPARRVLRLPKHNMRVPYAPIPKSPAPSSRAARARPRRICSYSTKCVPPFGCAHSRAQSTPRRCPRTSTFTARARVTRGNETFNPALGSLGGRPRAFSTSPEPRCALDDLEHGCMFFISFPPLAPMKNAGAHRTMNSTASLLRLGE